MAKSSIRQQCLLTIRPASASIRSNPLLRFSFGPRLQPIVHAADEEARTLAREAAESVLPRDRKGRARCARRFSARADRAAKRLGAPYHAERFWLFLPSSDGLPEVRHPLESAEG